MNKRILTVVMCAVVISIFTLACFADIGASDIAQITGALSDFSVSNILTTLVAALGVAVPLILIWFAFRKIFAWAKAAFYGG